MLLGIAGTLTVICSGSEAAKIIGGISTACGAILGFVSALTGLIFTAIQEQCRTHQANAFLLFIIVIDLLGFYVAAQAVFILFLGFFKNN